jgi:hypothetical protein
MYEVQASKCRVVLPCSNRFLSQFWYFKFIWRFSKWGLSLLLPVFKSFNSSFNTFFQFQKPLDLIQKLGSILCTHYTLSNARGYMQKNLWKNFATWQASKGFGKCHKIKWSNLHLVTIYWMMINYLEPSMWWSIDIGSHPKRKHNHVIQFCHYYKLPTIIIRCKSLQEQLPPLCLTKTFFSHLLFAPSR